MIKTAALRKTACMFLALLLIFASAAAGTAEDAAGAEKAESFLRKYTDCKTIYNLFRAAELALDDGMEQPLVLDEMYSLAEEQEFLSEFRQSLENSAAYGSEMYYRAEFAAGADGRKLDLGDYPFQGYWDKIGFDPWGHWNGTEAFMEMIADPDARYCLEAGFWTEKEFRQVYGTEFSKFRPSRPRAGYVCVVIAEGSESYPEMSWNEGDDARIFMNYMMEDVKDLSLMIRQTDSGMTPVFTGNPDIASSFWVFSQKYPFRGWYGHNNQKEVRGFNSETSLTVIDAATHQTTARISESNRLPNSIDTWHNGIAVADTYYLEYNNGFESFASKVEKAIEKQYASQDTSRRMTSVSAASVLNGILREQAEGSTDAWVRAICESGVRNAVLEKDQVSFSLRSYDPRTKDLGAYSRAEDGDAWLRSALENASAYDLELKLQVEDGRLTKQAKTSLANAVKKAASTAQAGFGGRDMASALSARLFPVPVDEKLSEASELLEPSASFRKWYSSNNLADTGLSVEELSIICYAQKSQALNAKGGPGGLELNCTGADPAVMIADCVKAALDDMAYAPAETRTSADDAAAALHGKLAEAAAAAHTKSSAKYSFTVDIDELAEGKNPAGWLETLAGFDTAEQVKYIRATAANFPEEAAESLPKTGIVKAFTSDMSGTRVTFELYDGAGPTYLMVLHPEHYNDRDVNSRYVSAFILPGQKVTLQIPEGYYRFAVCSGQWWYGEEKLFSASGSYWISETTHILGTQYSHTFSLDPSDEYELLFEEGSPNDFR